MRPVGMSLIVVNPLAGMDDESLALPQFGTSTEQAALVPSREDKGGRDSHPDHACIDTARRDVGARRNCALSPA